MYEEEFDRMEEFRPKKQVIEETVSEKQFAKIISKIERFDSKLSKFKSEIESLNEEIDDSNTSLEQSNKTNIALQYRMNAIMKDNLDTKSRIDVKMKQLNELKQKKDDFMKKCSKTQVV